MADDLSTDTAMSLSPDEGSPREDAPELPALTDRQRAFLVAYLGDARLDPVKAAIAVGLTPNGARAHAYEWARHPAIRAHVQVILESQMVSKEAILAELVAIAFAPTSHFMQILQAEYTDEHGRTHPAIIRQDYSGKTKALELLGKSQGMFSEKVDVNVTETKTIIGIDLSKI